MFEAKEYLNHLLAKRKEIEVNLSLPDALPQKNRDHSLTGNYTGCRECHIQPDWLLIYRQTDTELYLVATGTHADLFGL